MTPNERRQLADPVIERRPTALKCWVNQYTEGQPSASRHCIGSIHARCLDLFAALFVLFHLTIKSIAKTGPHQIRLFIVEE